MFILVPWLKVIRWQNLLIIFLTMFLAWWCVVLPLESIDTGKPNLLLNAINFICISASTLLIAAGGYIINDYFDIKIDIINRPDSVIIGKRISVKAAIAMHTVCNIIAVLLAGFVAWQVRHLEWVFLQLSGTLLLWFYSTHFKRQYIIGNVVVAFVTATLSVMVLIVYEPVLQQHFAMPLNAESIRNHASCLPVWVLIVYAFFAYMLTWIREIVKDMEDFKGDEQEGCKTMPVMKGLKYSIVFIRILCIATIITITIASVFLKIYNYNILYIYMQLCIVLPLTLWTIFFGLLPHKQDYGLYSKRLKIIMLLGILSLLIYHFQLFINAQS